MIRNLQHRFTRFSTRFPARQPGVARWFAGTRVRIAGIGLALAAFIAVDSLHAEDWPQWRGPNCSGVSLSKQKLPARFSTTENVKWSADLGDGICSPCV